MPALPLPAVDLSLSVCLSIPCPEKNSKNVAFFRKLFLKFPYSSCRIVLAMVTCSRPECKRQGKSPCSGCGSGSYCGSKCEKEDKSRHQKECDFRNLGNRFLIKAYDLRREQKWQKVPHCCDLALKNLKLLTEDRPLDAISEALSMKCTALGFMGQMKEALLCAQEWYKLRVMAHGPAHPYTIEAAFELIESLIHNGEYSEADKYAFNLHEIIVNGNNHKDNDIPDDKIQLYLARATSMKARATFRLAAAGGIPPKEKWEAGQEAIALARSSVEIYKKDGGNRRDVAISVGSLAMVLEYFSDGGDDDEVFSLFKQAIGISTRVQGHVSQNVATSMLNLGNAYTQGAGRAMSANDVDKAVTNLGFAISHFNEAAMIFRQIDRMECAGKAAQCIAFVEKKLRQIAIIRAATTTKS